MRTFTVWQHDKHGERKAERALFVADGFSIWAAVLAPFWLLGNRMFLVFGVYMAIGIGFNVFAAPLIGELAASIVSIAFAFWFGLEARALLRWSLSRRGWALVGIVNAKNLAEAEARFYGDTVDGPAVAPAPEPEPAAPPPYWASNNGTPLGLFPEPQR